MAQDFIISTQSEPQTFIQGNILRCPMLNIRTLPADQPIEHTVTDVILTSRHAVSHPDYIDMIGDRPCWCVGKTTESIARQFGLNIAKTGPSNVQALASILPTDRKYAHFGAETLSPHSATAFAQNNVYVQHIPSYRAEGVEKLPHVVINLLRDKKCSQILFFSARAGQQWSALITANQLTDTLREIKALCLSNTVLQSVDNLPWADVQNAANPHIQAMTDLISSNDQI